MALKKGDHVRGGVKLRRKGASGVEEMALESCWKEGICLLLFFPLAFTSVCTQEMCDVSEGIEAYKKLGVSVYGISVDSPFSQEAWAKEEDITVPLLSDFNREACQALDVCYPDLLGLVKVAKRSAFIVSKTGEVLYSWVSEDPRNLPPFNEIRESLKAIKG